VRLAPLGEATQITDSGPVADSESIEVAWIGTRPPWLQGEAVPSPADAILLASDTSAKTRVVHLARQAPTTVASVRAAQPHVAVVVDLGSAAVAPEDALRDAAAADIVLVESQQDAVEAQRRMPELNGKVKVVSAPVDLESFAPEPVLTSRASAYIKRFRRLHRLAHPSILFIGPYTRAGGLDIAIAAAYRLREQLADLRLAAVPLGAVDHEYLAECEMQALALGHRGIIEWTCPDDELRFWYATATVVCSPWRAPTEAPQAPVLAAAAARPFVGSDLDVFRLSFRAPEAPELVTPGDVDALVDALVPLLTDLPAAAELGEHARSTAEAQFSVEATAGRLASVWSKLAESSSLHRAA
jgi:glycosyltransferase involved in cell wall biosynthesis